MGRISKEVYYLDIAKTVAERGTCLRRKFGAIIVKDDVIISTGYNGAPRGRANCCDLKFCLRDKMQIPRGERYELCRSIHAEANAIIAASRDMMLGSTLYLACIHPETGEVLGGTCSCQMCKRMVINAGIKEVVVLEGPDSFTRYNTADWVENDDSLGTIGY